MKKWKIILPALLISTNLPLVSMVGCGDPETPIVDELEWNFVNGEYKNRVREKTEITVKPSEAIANFLGDAKTNPFIFLNDLFLYGNTIYQVFCMMECTFEKYYQKIKINEINPVNRTISFNFEMQLKGENTVLLSEMESNINLSFTNIPFASNISYLPSESGGKATTIWNFAPECTYTSQAEWFNNYFLNLKNGWMVNGTFYEKIGSNITNASFDNFDLTKLEDHGSFSESELSSIHSSMMYLSDLASQYYSKIKHTADYAIDKQIHTITHTILKNDNIEPIKPCTFPCFSVDTSLIPETDFASSKGFYIYPRTHTSENKDELYFIALIINGEYIGQFETSLVEFKADIPLNFGDQIEFLINPTPVYQQLTQNPWEITFGLSYE